VAQHSRKRDGGSFERVIDLCFDAAIRQCHYHVPVTSETPYYTIESMISQVYELAGLCIAHNDTDACLGLFRAVVMSEGSPEDKYQDFYRLLVPRLRQLLEKHAVDLCSPPFKVFMQFLIGQHLSAVLRAKPLFSAPTMRKIGCGCQGCNTLDLFMMSNNTTKEFPGVNRLGKHLEQQILGARDIVNSHRSHTSNKRDKAFTLVVNKRAEAHAATQWQARQKAAVVFLSSIGNADVIAKIMGPRYADVQNALAGVKAFVMDPRAVDAWQQIQGPRIPSVVASQNTSTTGLASGSTGTRAIPMHGVHTISRNNSTTLKRKRDGEP
jgi:hypothetical protein